MPPTKTLVVEESAPSGVSGSIAGLDWRRVFVSCVTLGEATRLVQEFEAEKARGAGCPRVVFFTDVDEFRRVATPLRLALLEHLTRRGVPESIHECARAIKRDYHTVLKDIQLLAKIGVLRLKESGPKGGEVPDVWWREMHIVVSPAIVGSKWGSVDRFSTNEKGQFTSWSEWRDTVSRIDDLDEVAALGLRAYHAHMGKPTNPDEASNPPIIRVIARILHAAFAKLSDDDFNDIRENLEGRGAFIEPGLWEAPEHAAQAHLTIEQTILSGNRPTLSELLMMGHDLEHYVRPNLLRLAWAARVATDEPKLRYHAQQVNEKEKLQSLSTAIQKLNIFLDKKTDEILNTSEKKELADFVKSIDGDAADSGKIGLDELRNWIQHRDFFIGEGFVILDLHTPPKRRHKMPVEQVTQMRHMTLGLMGITFALKVMFLASVVGRAGGFSPYPFAVETRRRGGS